MVVIIAVSFFIGASVLVHAGFSDDELICVSFLFILAS